MNTNQAQNFIEICRSFDNAMLVTQAADGSLQARPMVIAKLEDNGDLWFVTDSNSGKVDEIETAPRICVTLAGGGQYASISGMAEVVRDQATIQQLWSEPWKVWFPDGPGDPRIALIKVNATEGEYWSNSGTNRLKYFFEAAKAYVSGERPNPTDPTQHGTVQLR